MRFFLIKDSGGIVREKWVYTGDLTQVNSLIVTLLLMNPGLTSQEVDQVTFAATPSVPLPTAVQQAWSAFKGTNPLPLQAISYLAKTMGLE